MTQPLPRYPDIIALLGFLPEYLQASIALLGIAFLLSCAALGALLTVRAKGWPFAPCSTPYFEALLAIVLTIIVALLVTGVVLFYGWLADPDLIKELVALDEPGDSSDEVQEHPQRQNPDQNQPHDNDHGKQD